MRKCRNTISIKYIFSLYYAKLNCFEPPKCSVRNSASGIKLVTPNAYWYLLYLNRGLLFCYSGIIDISVWPQFWPDFSEVMQFWLVLLPRSHKILTIFLFLEVFHPFETPAVKISKCIRNDVTIWNTDMKIIYKILHLSCKYIFQHQLYQDFVRIKWNS